MQWLDRTMYVSALCFAFACAFHVAALVWPNMANPSPAWRHALFAAITALFAYAFARRSRWLMPAFSALTLQQLWGHGYDFWMARYESPPRWDWQSAVVLITLPLLVGVVFAHHRSRARTNTL